MIKVIEQTTEEREMEFQHYYTKYLELYLKTTLPVTEILTICGLSQQRAMHRRINKQIQKEDYPSPSKRALDIRKGVWL